MENINLLLGDFYSLHNLKQKNEAFGNFLLWPASVLTLLLCFQYLQSLSLPYFDEKFQSNSVTLFTSKFQKYKHILALHKSYILGK